MVIESRISYVKNIKDKKKMFYIRNDYQPLESQEQARQKLLTKISLASLVILQLVILMLWTAVIIDKKTFDQDSFTKDKLFSKETDDVIIETVILDDYTNEEYKSKRSECMTVSDFERFNCYPEPNVTELLCINRGCCWSPLKDPESKVPKCYYPSSYKGFQVLNTIHKRNSLTASLSSTFPPVYPNPIKLLNMKVQFQSDNILHIKILDMKMNRFEPPLPMIPVAWRGTQNPNYKFNLSNNGFKVWRKEGEIIFDCESTKGFMFFDQFLQISAKYFGKIYGLGEHTSRLELDNYWKKYVMFNRDGIPGPDANLYGSHPFYLVVEPSGKSHGVFFHNSNAMEVILQPLPAITFRSIGGVFDFYFFMGPTPADVIKQYTGIIGRPFLPPYWALGFHLSRLGYKDTDDIRAVWKRTRDAGIPFDTQWHDIDYMKHRNDFTIDQTKYAALREFVQEVHNAKMHYIPIIDPGISGCEPEGSYPPFDEGKDADVFIKNPNGSIFVGKVWNSECTVFPDFTSPSTSQYWSDQIHRFHKKIPFDGIWIDMNEPTNFLDGSFNGCPKNKWDYPVYVPHVVGDKLFDKTICMNTKQYSGLHYNLHNLYGLTEAVMTSRVLMELGRRPFVISRSTYPGSGRYGGHWSGDVMSTWEDMRLTIPQMLSFSLFGIPMMGSDICGFNGDTTVQLCQRWSQLGAFYPFSRNHNTDDSIDQDPVALGEEVVNSTRKALLVRYSLLPYLYTLFYKAHIEGETVARPLFFEFVEDNRTHSIDESFLWGRCILIVPVLKEFATTVNTYLPAGRWYDWYSLLGLESPGKYFDIQAPSDTIPIFIRGGSVVPVQTPNVTTAASRLNRLELIVALKSNMSAFGEYYYDDGVSHDSVNKKKYGSVNFYFTRNMFWSEVHTWGYKQAPKLHVITILGFPKPVKAVHFNKREVSFNWDKITLVLRVHVDHPIVSPFIMNWEYPSQVEKKAEKKIKNRSIPIDLGLKTN